MLIKSTKEIQILCEGGRCLATILYKIADVAKPGILARELNDLAEQMIREVGDKPSFLNYTPYGAERPYPAVLCVSINNEIVHGIPNERDKILKDGDIVGLDLGLEHRGLFVDMAVTIGIGKIDKEAERLIEVTKTALEKGILAARHGGHIGDISAAIEIEALRAGYGVVRELGGHGVGHSVHELPHIPNYGARGSGERLKEGMVLAIEPMFNEGSGDIILDEDGYTYKTRDGKRSAHFEHTVVITENGAEILTRVM